MPEEIFYDLLRDMTNKYQPKNYHVFKNNSNTFSEEVAQLILGESIPREYSQLPREFYQTSLG